MHKKLLSNSGALLSIQLANAFMPLLAFPYLTRTVGLDAFGVIAFSLALVQVACIVTDFGFNLSATYAISTEKNKDHISRTITAVTACKCTLLIATLSAWFLYVFWQETFTNYNTFLLTMSLTVIGQTLQPIWLFQGIQKMAHIALYTILSKTLFLLSIILLVHDKDSIIYFAIGSGASSILSACAGLILMQRLGYRFEKCDTTLIRKTFLASSDFFWSRAAVATYSSGTTIFIGSTLPPSQLALYAAAEQVYKAGQLLAASVSQALYPFTAKTKNLSILYKAAFFFGLTSIIGIIACYIIGEDVISAIYGREFIEAQKILLIFSFIFFITSTSVLFGYPYFAAFNRPEIANRTVLSGGIAQAALLSLLWAFNLETLTTIATSILIAELIVLTHRIYHILQIKRSK